MINTVFKDIQLGAQTGFQRHHDRFAQRIDWRVGNLSKLLTEVVRRQTVLTGQNGHWGVIPHGAYGFLTLFCQRSQYLITLFKADLVHLHMCLQFFLSNRLKVRALDLTQSGFQEGRFLTHPLFIRMCRFQTVVDIFTVHYFTGFGIHHQHVTRSNTAFSNNIFRLVIVNTDLRRQCDIAVLGDHPARRTQTVTVQHTNGMTTIGQYQTGRTIPRLHVHRAVFVEGTQIRIHGVIVLPSRRNHQTYGFKQIHTAGQQHFKHVIHTGRVRACGVHHLIQFIKIQNIVVEVALTGICPAAVSFNGVDLTVVRQIAERLSQRPFRSGIGREALVEYADRGFKTLITKVFIELRQIRRHHQTFIGDDLR